PRFHRNTTLLSLPFFSLSYFISHNLHSFLSSLFQQSFPPPLLTLYDHLFLRCSYSSPPFWFGGCRCGGEQ
ncbi:hypothetical protein VIGAN_04318700, partial [Vigna angularis var. angularis]